MMRIPTMYIQKKGRKNDRPWYKCRRASSSILVLCGMLLAYVVVSTCSFLAWSPPELADEVISAKSVVQESRNRHHAEHNQLHQRSAASQMATTRTVSHLASPMIFDLESPQPPFSIFYNVFMPRDQGSHGVQNSLDIVKEQMNQVAKSYAASFDNPVHLYYNTIGLANGLNQTYMQELCRPNNIHCHHMQHYRTGFEEYTLQRLSEYCHAQEPQSKPQQKPHRVIYMHNKGSFHSWNGENTRWRRHMTDAVTVKECVDPPDATCNVCGMLLFGAWALIMPGNFWSADCAYIRKLPPPREFTDRMDAVFELRRQKLQENPVFSIAFPDVQGIDDHGSGRYSQEHWVGSHPDMVPCDLTADPLADWREHEHSPAEFNWSMYPRKEQERNPDIEWKQPPLIAGNLFKYFTLYNQAPPDDSWVWRWFPYGEKYRQAVKKYGNRTFDIMVPLDIDRLQHLFGPLIPEGIGH